MEREKIRVLQIGVHDKIGGVETFIMNYYRNINRSIIQFDFISMFNKLCFEDEMINLGAKIYKVTNVKKNPIKYYFQLKKRIKENNYKIVHVNMLSAANIVPIIAAKKAGAKTIIAHSHNTDVPKKILKKFLNNINKNIIIKKATNLWACSKKAGNWMFDNKRQFDIIPNAIEMEKFIYNPVIREEIREKNNIKNELVIGHVGRMCEQKNHDFLIDCFYEVTKKNPNVVLMLIGEGEFEKKLRTKVEQLNISEKVKFIGVVNNVQDYFQAMDLFVLPSKFEGLGIVLIEAQTSGLQCIAADCVPQETNIFNKVHFEKLEKNSWSEDILKFDNIKYNRQIDNKKINSSEYNIIKAAKNLQNLYLKMN